MERWRVQEERERARKCMRDEERECRGEAERKPLEPR